MWPDGVLKLLNRTDGVATYHTGQFNSSVLVYEYCNHGTCLNRIESQTKVRIYEIDGLFDNPYWIESAVKQRDRADKLCGEVLSNLPSEWVTLKVSFGPMVSIFASIEDLEIQLTGETFIDVLSKLRKVLHDEEHN